MALIYYVNMTRTYGLVNGLGATGTTTRSLTSHILYNPQRDDALDITPLVYTRKPVSDFKLETRLLKVDEIDQIKRFMKGQEVPIDPKEKKNWGIRELPFVTEFVHFRYDNLACEKIADAIEALRHENVFLNPNQDRIKSHLSDLQATLIKSDMVKLKAK